MQAVFGGEKKMQSEVRYEIEYAGAQATGNAKHQTSYHTDFRRFLYTVVGNFGKIMANFWQGSFVCEAHAVL
jgi:hypothetical protein